MLRAVGLFYHLITLYEMLQMQKIIAAVAK